LLADAGLKVVTTGIRIPRMNSLMERWIQTCRFETFYNGHRPHRTLKQAAPLRPLPEPIDLPAQIEHLDVRRRDRLGGTLHEYQRVA
ncbi:integrase, partial [Streptomyces sp. NPDC001982]